MADEWQAVDTPPWLKQPAAPAEPQWQPIEKPPWETQKEEKPTRSVLQRAGEAMGETAGGAWEATKRLVVPPSKEEAQKHLGLSGAWQSFKETGESLLSPITGTAGTAIAGAASPIASGVSEAARRITGGDPRRSEEMYELARPMAEAALGAVGAKPGIIATPKGSLLPDARIAPTKATPGTGPEAEAGRFLESKASDPTAFRQKLQQPAEEIAGSGDKPTTFEHTGDLGIGQQTRAAARRPGQVEEHQARQTEQNRARIEALEQLQPAGDPAVVGEHLRTVMRTETAEADQVMRLAQQRAWEASQQIGGTYDPTTYGNIMRRGLQDAEEVTRAYERSLWQRVDPNGTLRANPQGVQELERRIYGVMPEGGAAEASLSPAERQIGNVIQNFPPQGIPFSELRTLRSMVSGELRNELISKGSTPAYARLSQLRGGIEEAISGSVPPEVYEQVRAATRATAQRAQTFRAEGVRQATRREGTQGPYRVGEASVSDQFIRPGTKGFDTASNYLRAVGQPGLEDFADAVAAKARREVIGVNGEINPRKLEGFLRRYQDVLRAIDDRDNGAFSQRLRNLGTAQDTLEAAEARQAAVAKKYKDDQFKGLLGTADETDAARMIADIFGKNDSVSRAQTLMSRLTGNEAAINGARAAVVRHIRDKLLTNAAVGDDPVIRSQVFQKWVQVNRDALSQILDPAQLKGLEDVARSLQRAARINQTKAVGGGSDTVQNALAHGDQQGAIRTMAAKYGPATARIIAHWIGNSLFGPISGGVAAEAVTAGVTTAKTARATKKAQRIQHIQDLVDDALLNPEKARKLLGKTTTYKSGRLPGARAITTYEAGALGAATSDDKGDSKKRRARQAGGGVPAIGGTGGRPPGARETARAGAARQRPRQALQDGGEAREQQAAAPVGSRERFAAALQATPTGAGFGGGGGGQQRKPKAPTSMSREEIRKTLSSFGITGEEAAGFGERQLGERTVDSRAEGGTVKRTKASVDYSKGMKESRCGICQHYSDHKCELVQGYIGPGMWCELFKKKTGAFATGGSVDYETGERSPIRYDPGDDTSFGARFGKWEQTTEGKSIPAEEDDDPDATVMMPGDRLIDPLGHRGVREKSGYYQLRGMQEGGAVEDRGEDRWAELPSSSNVEDRRGEDELSVGQLIAANQAFMGRYPSPYTRAPRAAPHSEALPNALVEQTKSYLADQIGGVERKHEKEDPQDALIEDQGGYRHPQGEGGSDEGRDPFAATAARTRRRAPVRAPDPRALAASQGKVGWGTVGKSQAEGTLGLLTAPGRAWRGELSPEEEADFGPAMGMSMIGMGTPFAKPGAFGAAGGRGGRPPRPPKLEAGEVPAADRPVTRSHNMPPEEDVLPVPAKRATSSLSLRDMPLDQAIQTARTEQHLIPSRAKEGYVGAPNWVKRPEDLARLRAEFDAQVERGLLGAKWYEEAQGGIKEMAGPEPRRRHQLSQELALTSAQATPETNLGFALQGHNAIAAGKPLDIVRTGQVAETLRKGHETGEIKLGRKTGIYARHMDPTMENPSTGTNDIWHARALGYENPEGGMGAAQHAFMDAETVLAVHRANEKKLGGRSDWTPGEIQAAPWVAGKAEGLQEQFGWSPQKAMAEAVKTYPQHFSKHTAYGTHEATPGVGTGHLPGIAEGTAAERARFARDPRSSWRDPSGRDRLYMGLDMWTLPSTKATGIYEGPKGMEVNPADVARPMVSFKGKPGSREVAPAERAMLTGAEAARAYVDAQNAGAWSVPIRNQKVGESGSVFVPRPGGGPLPLGDVKTLMAIGGRRGLPGVIDYGEGTALTSFGGEGAATGKQVATGLRGKGELGRELRGALPGTEPSPAKLDTGYIDYSGGWGKGEGSGAVTRELAKHLQSEEAPALIAKLDADPGIRRAVADRIARDIQIAAQTGQPIRADLQRARQIIVEDGFAGLFAALKRGVALPAAAFVPLVELLRQRDQGE